MKEISDITLNKAISELQAGHAVALPTETVYGLAADATNDNALKQIFDLKQRPYSHPLILHIQAVAALTQWAITIPDSAYLLAQAFWPGPLTLVLKKHPDASSLITAGQDSIAIRCPSHPIMQTILKRFNKPLCAPSANRFGKLSPTSYEHVKSIFHDQIYIVDGGNCEVGIESTILDLTASTPSILRAGIIDAKAISKILNCRVNTTMKKTQPVVPGNLPAHYAPDIPLKTYLHADLEKQLKDLKVSRCMFLSLQFIKNVPHQKQMPNDPVEYAKQLYATLHQLEKQKQDFDLILVETQETDEPAWQGVLDRLRRAAASYT